MKTCETCNAFQIVARDPAKPNDPFAGECHAKSPIILIRYHTQQGPAWTSGWPPVMSNNWCRQYQTRFSATVPIPLRTSAETKGAGESP